MYRNRYFSQYLIIFAVIFFAFFCVTFTMTYRTTMNSLSHQEQLENVSEFEKSKTEMENVFNTAMALGRLMLEYDCVKQYASSAAVYDEIDFSNVYAILQALRENQTDFSNMNLNMALMRAEDPFVITSAETMSRDDFYRETGVRLEEVAALFQEDAVSGYSYRILTQQDNSSDISLMFRNVYSDGSEIYLYLRFSQRGISYVHGEEERLNFITDRDCRREDVDTILPQAGTLESGVVRRVRSGEDNAALMYAALKNFPNLIYVSRFQDVRHLGLLLGLIAALLLSLAAALYLAYVVSRLVYKPINRLLGLFDGEEDFCGGDEVEFVARRAEQMLDMNRNLNRTLREKMTVMKNKFVLDLVNGFVWGSGIEQGIAEFRLDFLKEDCICVLFELEQPQETPGQFGVEQNQAEIFAMAEEELLRGTEGVGVTVENGRLLFITGDTGSGKQRVLNVINNVREETGIRVTAALGEMIRNLEDYKNVYMDLSAALDRRYILGGRDIITLKNFGNTAAAEYYYSLETERLLVNYVMSGDREKVMLLLKRILNRGMDSGHLSEAGVREFRAVLLISMKRLMQKINRTAEELFEQGEAVFEELERCEDRERFAAGITRVVKSIVNAVEHDARADEDRMCEQILQYIQQHLEIDISMNDVSQEFGISASTVTRRLKEKYNIGFKAYLNDCRIERAKEIMRENPEKMIKEIAAMVGFNNTVSFNRLFKQHEGISPGQYLENLHFTTRA